jgi:hypothetical protein
VWIVALALVCLALPIWAQDGGRPEPEGEIGAVLRIIFAGVEVRRANTNAWIAMRPGAQMALGAGDSVRTDLTGRAWIEFGVEASVGRVLLLPASFYTLGAYLPDAIDAEIGGRAVHQIAADGIVYRVFEPITPGFRVRAESAAHFATQSRPFRSLPILEPINSGTRSVSVVVAAAERPIQIMIFDDVRATVDAGEGLVTPVSAADIPVPIRLDVPLRFSELEVAATAEVCDAIATPTTAPRLLARIGANDDYRSMGAFDFGEPLRIVGRSESGRRYRIAYFSAFAWVVEDGVQLAPGCDLGALAVFPSSTVELPLGAVAVTPEELPLLQPFYGSPSDDPWFYRAIDDLNPR